VAASGPMWSIAVHIAELALTGLSAGVSVGIQAAAST